MRRILTLSLLMLLLSTSPAWAVFSFGVHGGFDINAEDAHTIGDELLTDGTSVSIERNKIDSPLVGGVHFRFGMLPVVDLELGIEGSIRKYHVLYQHLDGLTELERFDDDAYFGRISGYVSGKVNLINMPVFKGYGGAGVGYHVIAPLISRPLLEKLIVEDELEGDELDPAEILAKEGTMGFHLLAGLSFKPPFLPLALSVEGRYNMLPENDYGDETNRFMTFVFGLDLGF